MFLIFKSDIALEIHDNITSLLRYLFGSMPQCTASEKKYKLNFVIDCA